MGHTAGLVNKVCHEEICQTNWLQLKFIIWSLIFTFSIQQHSCLMFVPNRFNWNSNKKSTRFWSDHSNPFETFQLDVDEKLAPMVYVAKPAILGSWRAGRGIPESDGLRRRKMLWNCPICGINSHWGSWHKASTLSFLLNFLILPKFRVTWDQYPNGSQNGAMLPKGIQQ